MLRNQPKVPIILNFSLEKTSNIEERCILGVFTSSRFIQGYNGNNKDRNTTIKHIMNQISIIAVDFQYGREKH